MKITKRQLRKFIRETTGTLSEDRIADELEHLRKNIKDDEEHIDNLESDIEQEREEEGRAKKARRNKKDESTSFSVLHLLEGEMRESEMEGVLKKQKRQEGRISRKKDSRSRICNRSGCRRSNRKDERDTS